MSDYVERHRAVHQALERRDRDAIRAILSPHFTYTDHPRGLTMKTAEEYIDWLDEWVGALPDAVVSESRYLGAEHTSVAQFVGRGTNEGSMGALPPTGRRIALPFCEVFHYDASGLAVSGESYYDALTILVQLGHADPPPRG